MGGADWHSDSRDCTPPLERSRQMKHLLLTTIAAVVLVGTAFADPIHDAADAGDLAGVQAELDKGVNVNAKEDDYGWTPLHNAADYGHKEIAELLIANGADVNAKGMAGFTPLHLAAKEHPLHLAAKEGLKETIELLIAKGADVNAKDDYGTTPLDLPDDEEIADLLRKHGGKTGEELKAEGK